MLNALIRLVNNMFRDLCIVNGFGFICNDMITTKYRWKDLQDLGTSILSKKCIDFVNNYLFSNFDNHFWLNESHQTNNFDSDIGGLINFRKAYQNNPFIGYIDINSLRGIIKSLHRYMMYWRNKTRCKFPWPSVLNIRVSILTN